MRQCARRIGALAQTRDVVCAWAAPMNMSAALQARMYAIAAKGSSNTNSKSSTATDAQMQREIFKKAMESGSSHDSTADVTSLGAADGFTEERHVTPGVSHEDAFGHSDPLMAVEQTVQGVRQETEDHAVPEDDSTSHTADKAELAKEIDQVVSGRNRRRNRRRRSMDSILGDVLHDALRLRDMGEKPTAEFVYKRAQERIYEEEYGKKPPSAKETAAQYIPFPPDFHMHRLLPLFGDATSAEAPPEEASAPCSAGDDAGAGAAQRPSKPSTVYMKNHMNMYALLPPDPWPERAITPENPVWTRRAVEEDKQKTGGKRLREWEERMFAPRPGHDFTGEFVDAMDELAHWEKQFLVFVRVAPISQRRSLPFLHEWHRFLVHRVVRAERRYIRIRDALLSQTKASAALFARTEELVEDVRGYYAETHRSLSSPNYDPLRMKKSVLAPVLRMTDAEFDEWQEVRRQKRNALAAELS
jgi:hypothetical protein